MKPKSLRDKNECNYFTMNCTQITTKPKPKKIKSSSELDT